MIEPAILASEASPSGHVDHRVTAIRSKTSMLATAGQHEVWKVLGKLI
jgi:hypothetical protein